MIEQIGGESVVFQAAEVRVPETYGEMGRAVIEGIAADRERLAEAKTAVLQEMKRAAASGEDLGDVRETMFRAREVRPEQTMAALRDLELEGFVEVGDDYRFKLTD